jgi:hypothetical protein
MSGPTTVPSSLDAPTFIERVASATRGKNVGSSYTDASTIARLAAEHFWPA